MTKSGMKDFRFGIESSANGLDLNQLLVSGPSSTFFMRLDNDVPQLEFCAGDILQVDRSLTPKPRSVVVVYQEDDPDMKVVQWGTRDKAVQLWGVVVHCIRSLQ